MDREERNRRIRAERPTRTLAEIGKEFGLSGEMVRLICKGIDGPKRAPKLCIECGQPRGTGTYCADCAQKVNQLWTRQVIIDALKRFEREFGRRPAASDLSSNTANRRYFPERVTRFEETDWLPHINTVIRRFGTFNQAMRAAGLRTNRPGEYDRSKTRQREKAE